MKKVFFIAGGRTGGHITPLIPLMTDLKKKDPHLVFHYFHSKEELQKKLLSDHCEKDHSFPSLELRSKAFSTQILTLLKIPFCLLKTIFIFLKYKPVCSIGTGGAVSFPLILCSYLFKTPRFLIEMNAKPGLTNKVLSYFTTCNFIYFKSLKKDLKGKNVFIKPLVRKEIKKLQYETPSSFRVLVLGGSQGSLKINEVIEECVEKNPQIFWHHQCGKNHYEKLKQRYLNQENLLLEDFITDMKEAYKKASLIISRSGMGFLSELIYVQKPSILIPLPSSASGHQLKNALNFVRNKQASLLEEKDLNSKSLMEKILLFKERPLMAQEIKTHFQNAYTDDECFEITDYISRFYQ